MIKMVTSGAVTSVPGSYFRPLVNQLFDTSVPPFRSQDTLRKLNKAPTLNPISIYELSDTASCSSKLYRRHSPNELAATRGSTSAPGISVGNQWYLKAVASSSLELAPHDFHETQKQIKKYLDRLFEIAEEEQFEDGMDSNLGIDLQALLHDYPVDAIQSLEKYLDKKSLKWETMTETLKTLARVERPETAQLRLNVIIKFLNHASILIRDAALVAITLLADQRAIYPLEHLAREEKNLWFKQEIEAAIRELRG